jgi:hypothetical protein
MPRATMGSHQTSPACSSEAPAPCTCAPAWPPDCAADCAAFMWCAAVEHQLSWDGMDMDLLLVRAQICIPFIAGDAGMQAL